jgi:hypothetical protein
MAWILESIVEEIYTAYEALPGGREPLSRDEKGKPQFGNLEKARHAAVGKTVWMLQGGNFGSPLLVGGPDGATHMALARFLIWIWEVDHEACWNKMVDLIAAVRATVFGPNMGLTAFTVPTETEGRELHQGEVWILDLTVSVPIPAVGSVPVTTVELESHQSSISMGAESAVLDETFTAIETAEVTGPPED